MARPYQTQFISIPESRRLNIRCSKVRQAFITRILQIDIYNNNNNVEMSLLDIIKQAVHYVRICFMYITDNKKKYIGNVRTKKKKK
jgi:hypothetical protein